MRFLSRQDFGKLTIINALLKVRRPAVNISLVGAMIKK
jgi:hypothetical protein